MQRKHEGFTPYIPQCCEYLKFSPLRNKFYIQWWEVKKSKKRPIVGYRLCFLKEISQLFELTESFMLLFQFSEHSHKREPSMQICTLKNHIPVCISFSHLYLHLIISFLHFLPFFPSYLFSLDCTTIVYSKVVLSYQPCPK